LPAGEIANRKRKEAAGLSERAAFERPQACGTGDGVMIKTLYAVTTAAFAAGCFVAFPSLSGQVHATPPAIGAKGDRADLRPLGIDCGQNTWPYFDAACTRDAGNPLKQPRAVRFVFADRFPN
jgi:hypothetical protein